MLLIVCDLYSSYCYTGSHGSNLFKGKSAAFASVDSYNPHNFGGAWDTSLHSPNLYHLRQLASVVGLNCLHSKFDLHPGKHYSTDSEELDDAQVLAALMLCTAQRINYTCVCT